MCRLFGLTANKPVDVEFSLLKADKPFRNLGEDNPDGWGIGWYEDNKAKIFKEGISAKNSERFCSYAKEVRSNIVIVHVRKGTGAPPSEVNSHPFKYKNWLFAHNGSVDRDYLLDILKDKYKKELKGETDSEIYFYWILQCIEETKDVIEGIKKAIDEIIKSGIYYTGLNFLLSDGKFLYAFRYSRHSKDYYSLWLLKREPSESGPLEFRSKETSALLRSKALKGEKAVLVCSEKLTEEKWEEIEFGKLLIIDPNLSIKEMGIV